LKHQTFWKGIERERERSENVNNSSVIDEFVKLNMQGPCISTNYPGQRIDGDRQDVAM
jgi:hypothetical protein